MPWTFDRLYKYDITSALHDAGLHHDDTFSITIDISALNGTVLNDLIPTPSILFVPGTRTYYKHT